MKNPNGGVAIARGWNVSKIDVIDKIAYLEDGSTIQYDKCLLATGIYKFSDFKVLQLYLNIIKIGCSV